MKNKESNSTENAAPGKERRRGISTVWVVPVVALAISGWFFYNTYQSQGPQVVISFESAEGLQAGKSKVKFLETEIGDVTDIAIDEDHKGVLVTVELVPSTKTAVTEDIAFWVVRPQLKVGEISGLGTLLSGAYIATLPGTPDKKLVKRVTGLERAPLKAEHPGGATIALSAQKLKSVNVGAPVLYRGLRIGTISSRALAKDQQRFLIDAYIYNEYRDLLVENAVFWNVGGFEIDVGKGHIKSSLDSLSGLLEGGIEMDFLGGKPGTALADEGHSFELYENFDAVESFRRKKDSLKIVFEAESGGSLNAGESIYYRKMVVGVIDSIGFSEDLSKVVVEAHIHSDYRRLATDATHFWNASGVDVHLGLRGLNVSTESLATLLVGGIAMGIPDEPGNPVSDGQHFILYSKPEKHWRKSQGATPDTE